MRAFRLLVLRRIRQAPLRSAMAVVCIATGVALAVSISILIASLDRSLTEYGRGLAGPAPLRITGATLTGGLPEAAVERAAAAEGVEAVVPMVQVISRVQPTPGGPASPVLLLGVGCEVEALVGPFGCDPATLAAATGPLAAGPGVRGGPDAVVRTDLGRLPLGTVPIVEQLDDVADGDVVLLPLPLAQRELARPAELDVAYVLPEPGADLADVRSRVQAAVGPHLPVRGATEPPAAADALLGGALPVYSLLGVFTLGIGAVLVANTAAMALESRRRELAIVGALGGRPAALLVAAITEMGVLGAIGGALGTAGGMLVASPIVASFSSFTEEVAGARLSVHVPASALVVGVLLGGLLGAGSAVVPAWRATRLDVAAELSGRERADTTRVPRLGRRIVIWGALAALGAVGCWLAQRDGGLQPWQAGIVTPAFVLVSMGALFASAALAPLLTGRLGDIAARTASGPLRLAVGAARRDHRRTGLLAVTVGAAVATAFVTEGSSRAARASIEAAFAEAGDGVDVSTLPFDDPAAPALPREVSDRLAQLPGVDAVHRGVDVVTGMAGEPILVLAVTDNPLTPDVIRGEASPDRLAAGEVLIGAGLARQQGIGVGDEVELPTPDGPVHLPVQGIWEEGGNVGNNVTMSAARLEELFGPQPAGFVAVSPVAGTSEQELAEQIEAAGLDPELRTRSSAAVADAIADQVDEQFASFRVMQQALLAVLFAAVLSSLLLAAVQRRRELGLLAAVGADPPSLARLLLLEAGVVAAVGLAMTVVVGPLMMFALNQALPFVVGFRNPLVFDWFAFVTAGMLAFAVVLAAAAWPARRAARVEVLEALRYE